MQSKRRLALVSQVDELSTPELTRVAAAIQTQITGDFAPAWGIDATLTAFQTVADVPVDYWPVIVQSPTAVGPTLGYHTTNNGVPYALVSYQPGWTMAASHQCLEVLADPNANRLISGPSPKPGQGRVSFLVQVCDPCLAEQYAYEIDGVTVSDFLLPAFYGGEEKPFDFRGAMSRPWELLPGGYISWQDPESGRWWQQVYYGEQPEFRELGVIEVDDEAQVAAVEGANASVPSLVGRLAGATNDQVGAVDQLGFRDYVTAFADLIGSQYTEPPITIGIFGSWGVGKSFLLQHIRDELGRRGEARQNEGD